MTEYCFVETQPVQFNDCLVGVFTIVGGRFKNYCNKINSSKTAINEKFVISNTTEIFMTFGVPVSYLYWMGVIEFFHRLNLHIRCYPRAAAVSDSHRRLALGCW